MPQKHRKPSVNRLREVLSYNKRSGALKWRRRKNLIQPSWNTRFSGKEAGTIGVAGYVMLPVDYHMLYAHRVIWAMVTGRWPKHEVDHANGVRRDNRWRNLREATRSQNAANTPKTNRLGRGVKKDRNRFVAWIEHEGCRKYLGSYAKATQAHAAYVAASKATHGIFSIHNR